MILDTQVASNLLGTGVVSGDHAVTSTTLQEIFGMQGAGNTRNRFYLPLLKDPRHLISHLYALEQKKGSHGKIRPHTDRLIVDFNTDHPTVVEYSHRATCRLLGYSGIADGADFRIFSAYARKALPKPAYSVVADRYRALAASSMRFIPLTADTAQVALSLLPRFKQRYNLKSDFRNSLNDLLILATAIRTNEGLRTDDQVLSSFAAEVAHADVATAADGLFEVTFGTGSTRRRVGLESKGYINLGWRVRSR